MTRVVCSLEHPIIFVFDFDNEEVEIPDYDPDSVVSKNQCCLSVRAVSETDGDVNLSLNESLYSNEHKFMTEVFEGTIFVPNERLAIVNSINEKLLETEVSSKHVGVRVLVDNEDLPESIEVFTFSP